MWGLHLLYHSAHIIIWKTDKKNLLDQYKFREEIIESWMDGNNEDALTEESRKQERSEVVPKSHSISLRSSTISESDIIVRGRRIDDKALDPTNGTLKCCLDLDTDFHSPSCNRAQMHPVVFAAGL
jgi:hypothetical protein